MKYCIQVFIFFALSLSFNVQTQNVGIGTTTAPTRLTIGGVDDTYASKSEGRYTD